MKATPAKVKPAAKTPAKATVTAAKQSAAKKPAAKKPAAKQDGEQGRDQDPGASQSVQASDETSDQCGQETVGQNSDRHPWQKACGQKRRADPENNAQSYESRHQGRIPQLSGQVRYPCDAPHHDHVRLRCAPANWPAILAAGVADRALDGPVGRLDRRQGQLRAAARDPGDHPAAASAANKGPQAGEQLEDQVGRSADRCRTAGHARRGVHEREAAGGVSPQVDPSSNATSWPAPARPPNICAKTLSWCRTRPIARRSKRSTRSNCARATASASCSRRSSNRSAASMPATMATATKPASRSASAACWRVRPRRLSLEAQQRRELKQKMFGDWKLSGQLLAGA